MSRYNDSTRPTWQKALVVGATLGLVTVCFIHAGIWAFIAALLAFLVGAALGVVVGAESGRRDRARRIELLEQHYEHATDAARTAVRGHAEAAARLHRAEEDLRAAHADQVRLRARLDELDQPSELSDLAEVDQPAAEAQPQP